MVFIEQYIADLLEGGMQGQEIAIKLDISNSMVSSYKHGDYNPSIAVAKHLYKTEGITLHPFSEESLKFELNGETYDSCDA